MSLPKNSFLEIYNSIDFAHIKDHPNILIAARFWEEERYNAAKACYKFMRAIDDLIDNYKATNTIIAPAERAKLSTTWSKKSPVLRPLRLDTGNGSPKPKL